MPANPQLRYVVDIRHNPSVPNNIKHWRVLHDDEEIKRFLELTGEFSTSQIDQDEDTRVSHANFCFQNTISNHDIIELKWNFIPKCIIHLERIFSNNDIVLKPIV